MISTITGTRTADITAIITGHQRNTDLKTVKRKSKGGAWRLPLLCLDCVVPEAR
jgi:hypothetical protein